MGELEKYIDNLIRQVKDPKKKKDLISRLKASQSKEQPLEQLTDGKLEEIEKLKKKLKTVSKLNKSLATVIKREGEKIGATDSKQRRSSRVGNPMSGRSQHIRQDDSRLRTTGAGTGWRGFTEKPEVKPTLPIGHEKKRATTFATHRKQPYGEKAPLSKLVPTNVKTDDPTPLGQGTEYRDNTKSPVNLPGGKDPRGKDSASPTHGTPAKQGKITTAKQDKKSKRRKAKDFLNRLIGRGKKDKKLAQGQGPRPGSSTASNQSSRQASQQNYQQSTTQDKTSQSATADMGQKQEQGKKQDKKQTADFTADDKGNVWDNKKESKTKKEEKKDEDPLTKLMREHKEAKKKREEIFEGKKNETPKEEPKKEKKGKKGKGKKSTRKKDIEDFLGSRYSGSDGSFVESGKTTTGKKSQIPQIRSAFNIMNTPTHASKINRKNLRRGKKKSAIIKAMADFLEKDASGYGDLGVANVYPMDSYNEPSLIGKPVGEIKTPINDSETYILNGQNKGKENEQNN